MEAPQLYHVLPSRHIRVLEVASGADDEALRCKLRVVDLDKNPAFTALSYVWGAYAPTPHSIVCDDSPFDVTINCHSALWHLRKQLGSFTIWVDAICIDQSNLEEKASQIPLMEDIYAKAEKVFIWMGAATKSSDRVMKYLATYGVNHYEITKYHSISPSRVCRFMIWKFLMRPRAFKGNLLKGRDPNSNTFAIWKFVLLLACSTYWPIWHPFPLSMLLSTILHRASLTAIARATWIERLSHKRPQWLYSVAMAFQLDKIPMTRTKPLFHGKPYAYVDELEELLNQPYATRIWTYQELLLASNPVLVCGTSHLDWHDFACTIVFLAGISAGTLASLAQRWERIAFDRAKLHQTNLTHCEWVIRNAILFYLVVVVIAGQTRRYFGMACVVVGIALLICHAKLHSNTLIAGAVLIPLGTAIYSWSVLSQLNAKVMGSTADKPLVFKSSTEGLPFALFARTSTHPLDIAYGTYAILRRRGATLAAPSYDRSLPDVYHDLTMKIIELTHSLDFLGLAAAFPLYDSPSWVPDWRGMAPALQPVDTEIQFIWRRVFQELDRDLREAIKVERQSTDWSVKDNILTVQAHEVGQVKAVDKIQYFSAAGASDEKGLHNSNLEIFRNIGNNPAQRQAYLLALIGLSSSGEYTQTAPDLPTRWYEELCVDGDWAERPEWFRRYQIWLCNHFSQWRVCKLNLGTEDYVALVKSGEVGDRIVRIKSMLDPIAVRDVGSGNHVEIAGAFRAIYHHYWWKAVDDWRPKEVVFEEFHIH